MIESYRHDEQGYNPFLIRPGWQVAKLNYVAEHGLDDITDIEVHMETDEVFILLEGTGILIDGRIEGDNVALSYIKMEKGTVYNVPAGVWHNIAMSRDAEIIIVEKDNTHHNDVKHFALSDSQKKEAYKEILNMSQL